MKGAPLILNLCALVPMSGYGLVAGFAISAYQQTGHWPVYGQPDPKDAFLGVIVLPAIALAVLLVPPAFAVLVTGETIGLVRSAPETRPRRVQNAGIRWAAFIAGAVLFVLALMRHWNWLLD